METRTRIFKTFIPAGIFKNGCCYQQTFGLQHIEIAEDIVSETFLQATETWGIKAFRQIQLHGFTQWPNKKHCIISGRNKILDKKIIPELKITIRKHNEITK